MCPLTVSDDHETLQRARSPSAFVGRFLIGPHLCFLASRRRFGASAPAAAPQHSAISVPSPTHNRSARGSEKS
jgi:hypothetical protein